MAARKRTTFEPLPPPDPAAVAPSPVQRIEAALAGLRFGHVTVFVQDGVIVLIERTEKTRVV